MGVVMSGTDSDQEPESGLNRRRRSARLRDAAGYSEKRDRIVASAAAAFREQGYDRTTLADIARRAGTDRASIYYYASNKQDLFKQVCLGLIDSSLAAVEEIAARDITASDKLELIIRYHLTTQEQGSPQLLVQELPRITEAGTTWNREAVWKTARNEWLVRSILEKGIADGTLRDDVELDLANYAIVGMLDWTHRWYRHGGRYDADAVATAFAAIATRGLATNHPDDGAA
jgi:AcrR family transcriptional regulator